MGLLTSSKEVLYELVILSEFNAILYRPLFLHTNVNEIYYRYLY